MVIDNIKAEFMVSKSFVMNELCTIDLNIDTLRAEQCDKTKQLKDNFKNMWEEIATKNTIIKLLPENLSQIKNSFYKTNIKSIITKNQGNGNCQLLKDNSFMRYKDKKII